MKFVSKSLEETQEAARIFIDSINMTDKAVVVALQGNLGAGKTAFTQECGKILGVTLRMQSPTFVIEKIYPILYRGFKNLIHIDAYRLEKDHELLVLGWEDIVKAPENLIFIEWPENVAGIIPDSAKRINFKFVDENTREIEFDA